MFGDQVFRKSSYSGAANNCVEVASWRKSSFSGAGKDCVEVADSASGMFVRDSKQPDLGHLTFASEGWSTFVTSLKAPGA